MTILRSLAILGLLAFTATPAFAHGKPAHGGQITEIDEYQFELVVEDSAAKPHLDVYLIDPNDKNVGDAKIVLRVTTPESKHLVIPLVYEEAHYTAALGSNVKGDYSVVVLSTVHKKRVNARFTFKL